MELTPRISIPYDRLADVCKRFGIQRLALFGSVLRDVFSPESDVDVLIEFAPGSGFTFENTPLIIGSLRQVFGRSVDVVEPSRIRNRFRRASILGSQHVVYAA